MKNFEYIKALVGDDVTERDLQNVDCFTYGTMGLFIPTTGHCGYAERDGHKHPSYMIVVMFSDENKKCTRENHYRALIMSPEPPHNDIFDEFRRYYCLMIDKEYFESQYKLYEKNIPRFEWYKFELCADILKTLNTFAFECSKAMPNSDITLEAQSTVITHWIIRSILGENLDMRSISQNYFVARAQQYIAEHYDEHITVRQLAELGYVSVSTFQRTFKRETGLSPTEYIISERLERSKILLRRQNISVTDVALRCGFSDNAHFSSCFKRFNGITPTEYQKAFME